MITKTYSLPEPIALAISHLAHRLDLNKSDIVRDAVLLFADKYTATDATLKSLVEEGYYHVANKDAESERKKLQTSSPTLIVGTGEHEIINPEPTSENLSHEKE